MNRKKNFIVNLVIWVLAVILVSGCASTVPKPQFTEQIAPETRMTAKDKARVTVVPGKGVSMNFLERLRLRDTIIQKLDEFKIVNDGDNTAKTYSVNLTITRYEKGNAIARMMLAGLGQIHIDGDIEVYQVPGKIPVGDFSLSKTFAWGGLYGGSTRIKQIEVAFAEGVAKALTGHE